MAVVKIFLYLCAYILGCCGCGGGQVWVVDVGPDLCYVLCVCFFFSSVFYVQQAVSCVSICCECLTCLCIVFFCMSLGTLLYLLCLHHSCVCPVSALRH